MTLSFEVVGRQHVDPPFIALISLIKGSVCYSCYDNVNKEYINDIDEPYELALKLVKAEGEGELNTALASARR